MYVVVQLFQNPNVCLLFSARRVCVMLLQLYTGILPFMPVKETHLEIFMPAQMVKLVPLLCGCPGAQCRSLNEFPLVNVSVAWAVQVDSHMIWKSNFKTVPSSHHYNQLSWVTIVRLVSLLVEVVSGYLFWCLACWFIITK